MRKDHDTRIVTSSHHKSRSSSWSTPMIIMGTAAVIYLNFIIGYYIGLHNRDIAAHRNDPIVDMRGIIQNNYNTLPSENSPTKQTLRVDSRVDYSKPKITEATSIPRSVRSDQSKFVSDSPKQTLDYPVTSTTIKTNSGEIDWTMIIDIMIKTKTGKFSNNLMKLQRQQQGPSTKVPPSVLVVGGTDGSGTRRVVQTLADLGVTMVSEDPQTYDIHADAVGGWPTIVKPLLKYTHTINFPASSLPSDLKQNTMHAIGRLLNIADGDSRKPQSNKLAVGGALNKKYPQASARFIQYGFKAPVAMTLLPLWAEQSKNFRFLHVLRDGRDIAFSANQGPVEKFYTDMYPDSRTHQQARELKAIHLWSDWNQQAFDWSESYIQQLDGNSAVDRPSYAYFVLHSEDLVSEDVIDRATAIYQLAAFVGSTLSREQICCIANQDSEFMGSHDGTVVEKKKRVSTGGRKSSQVSSRYGKWKRMTENNPQLRDQLNRVGQRALQTFDYLEESGEGSHTEIDGSALDELVNDCIEMIDSVEKMQAYCPENIDSLTQLIAQAKKDDAAAWMLPGICQAEIAVDHKGDDLSSFSMEKNDLRGCCQRCHNTAGCRYFTIDVENLICYLKTGPGETVQDKRTLISGSMM